MPQIQWNIFVSGIFSTTGSSNLFIAVSIVPNCARDVVGSSEAVAKVNGEVNTIIHTGIDRAGLFSSTIGLCQPSWNITTIDSNEIRLRIG